MRSMIDPMNALLQFKDAFEIGMIPVQPGRLDPNLLFALDEPNGHLRFNYMRAEDNFLTALVMFAQNGLKDGKPVFNIGYAVAETHRGRGLAKSTLMAALKELSAGLAGASIPVIEVEAVISPDNLPSQAVARTIFDTVPTPITDNESGLPALHYLRKVIFEA